MKLRKINLIFFFISAAMVWPLSGHAVAPSSFFNFEGKLTDSSGNIIDNNDVVFTVGIYDPSGTCRLYEEVHTSKDLSSATGTNGLFNLLLGGTDATRSAGVAGGVATNFKSAFMSHQTFGSEPTHCAAGYTRSSGDSRLVKVVVAPNGLPVETLPTFSVGSSPTSNYAETLQGKLPSEFLQTNTNAANVLTQTNLESVFSTPNYTELLALLAGTSTTYHKSSQSLNLSSQQTVGLGQFDNTQEAALIAGPLNNTTDVGKTWVNTDTGKVMYWNGTSAVDLTATGGGVATFNARSGTVVPVAGDYNASMITNTAAGDISSTDVQAALNELDGEKLSKAGGTMTGAIAMGGNLITGVTDPASAQDAATKAYVDSSISTNNGSFVAKAGDTMTGSLLFTGSTAQNLGMNNHLTADTAGNDFFIFAGGATTGATDKDGGTLKMTSGISTGTGSSKIELQTATPAASGTANNTPTTKMSIMGDGKIGVGTAAPERLLHLQSTTKADVELRTISDSEKSVLKLTRARDNAGAAEVVQDTDTVGKVQWDAHDGTNFLKAARIQVDVDGTPSTGIVPTKMSFRVTSTAGTETERMVILPDGSVGIGEAAPSALLNVERGSGDVAIFEKSQDDDVFRPVLKLSRSRSSATSPQAGFGGELQFRLEGSTNDTEVNAGGIGLRWEQNQSNGTTDRDSALDFATMLDNTKTVNMSIASSGNVGIGTTAPQQKLDVAGGIKVSAQITAENAANVGYMDSFGGSMRFFSQGPSTGTANRGAIDFNIRDSNQGNSLTPLKIKKDGNVAIVPVAGSGNVGVGILSPTTLLHVSGGTLTINGTGAFLDYRPNNVECADGEVLKWTAADRWECATDSSGSGGITSLGGLTGGAQTLNNGFGGLTPSFTSSGTVHTLNIPLASTASVTSGTISKTDYDNFSGKVDRAGDAMTGPLAMGSNRITGLGTPSSGTDAVNKTYADGNLLGQTLAAPGGGQIGQAIRWNAGGTAWEYYTPANADNLGDHEATQNIDLNTFKLVGNNGTAGISIDSAGNVGIGTTSPDNPLHILDGSDHNIAYIESSTGKIGGIQMGIDTDLWRIGSQPNQNLLKFSHGNTTAPTAIMTLSDSGTLSLNGTGAFLNYQPNGTECTNGQILEWNSTSDQWLCANDDTGATGSAGGSLTGTYPNPTIASAAVGTAEVADNTLTAADLAPNSVDGSELVDGSVDLTELDTASVDGRYVNVTGNTMTGALSMGTSNANMSVSDTAALPAFTWSDDLNTGLFNPAADQIGLSTGGAEQMRIDASGNVGIGTTAPSEKLEVDGNILAKKTGSTSFLAAEHTAGAALSLSAGTGAGAFLFDQNFEFSIQPRTRGDTLSGSGSNTTKYFVVDGNGNVGIGIDTSPDFNLEVVGDLAVSSAQGADGDRFIVNSSGNVGIGTNSPSGNLHLSTDGATQARIDSANSTAANGGEMIFSRARGTIAAKTAVTNGDETAELRFMGYDGDQFHMNAKISAEIDGVSGDDDMPGRLVFSTTSDGATSPSERMRITDSGQVGIGTTNPSAGVKLEVSGGTTVLEQESVISVTFQNGYFNFGAPYENAGFYLDSTGRVHLRGVIRHITTSSSCAFTLPTGYRPANERLFVAMNNGGNVKKVVIESNGCVKPSLSFGDNVSLDGISFRPN